jgi:hypothetical protein
VKIGATPVLVGVFVVWRRGEAVLRLAVLIVAIAGMVRMIVSFAPQDSMRAMLLLAFVTFLASVMAWFGVRALREPVKVLVSSRTLTLEPLRGGPVQSWAWEEVDLSLHPDDQDGTLQIRSRSSGVQLVARTSESSMSALLSAIARSGGRVR